jgi:hypothetical protein
MITGNITVSSRPNEDDLRASGICSACMDECSEVGVDESYDDHFGVVTVWGRGSDCCEAEVWDGEIFLRRSKVHTARKDHLNADGRVIIAKGERYKATLRKGYAIDEDGKHHGIFEYRKKKVSV